MKRKKDRLPTRPSEATVRRGALRVAVPISAQQLQYEVERLRENADINARRHRFSPHGGETHA